MKKSSKKPQAQPYRTGWRCRGTETLTDGTKERIEAYGDTQKAAEQAYTQKLEARNAEILLAIEEENARKSFAERKAMGNITVAEAVEARLKERETEITENKGRPVRDSTISCDRSAFKTLIQNHKIGAIKIKDITIYNLMEWRKDTQNYISVTRKKPLSASYKDRAYALLNYIFNDYYRFRGEKNPFDANEPWTQKRPHKTKNDFLVGEELNTFIQYCEYRKKEKYYPLDALLADMFILQLLLYRRPGEIRGLKVKDWKPSSNTLSIQRTGEHEDGRTKTDASMNEIKALGMCEKILNERCSGKKPDEYIFPNPDAINGIMRNDSYNKTFQKWLQKAGIQKNLHAHSLRGSGISFAQRAGAKASAISANAGHADMRTTQEYYTVCYDEDREEAAEIMARAFS
jgi:integrase